jgi:hypothetical protein
LGGIVGRRAVIRGAEYQNAALFRQLAHEIIERRKLGIESVDLGKIGDTGCEFFGSSEIRSV